MSNIKLPYKWREKVQQLLENQNINLNFQQITDIKCGKSADEELTKIVMQHIRAISKEYRQKKNRIARLTAKKIQ